MVVSFFKPPPNKPLLIYQLGTNNWQREGEFAPGSGILHQSHHSAYNSMTTNNNTVRCYSLYPSERQSVPHEDPTVCVYKLSHPIPICESASPVSNYRWHGFTNEQFQQYQQRLESTVYDQMEEAERIEKTNFSLVIAHHTFLNPLVMRNVLKKRLQNGKPPAALCCFVHGTALKMYVHEQQQDVPQEFPLRFLPMIRQSQIFETEMTTTSREEDGQKNDDDDDPFAVQLCYAISSQQVDAFLDIFPTFSRDRIKISPNGINQSIFHPIGGATIENTLCKFDNAHYEGSPYPAVVGTTIDVSSIRHVVILVSKFAEWKRIPSLLYAAQSFQGGTLTDTAVIIVGTGPWEAQKQLQDLAYGTLKLRKCYFLGPQPQHILAELYSIASVGVFPSYREPFGLVFVECMSTGTPVIGAKSGGPVDFVTPDVGYLVDETNDIMELGRRLDVQIQNAITENWKATKGEACKKLVTERFSVMKQCTELLEFTREHLQI